ncbi:MAG: endopeptidase La, partial [Armatimonadetes bacterium Cent15-Ar3]
MSEVKLPIEEDMINELELDASMAIAAMDATEDEQPKPVVPEELSILPLRDSVVYPMLIAPLSVSRENGIQLIDESVSTSNRVIGVVAQRDPSLNEPGFDGVYEYGCAVIIRTLVKMNDTVRLIVQGIQRFRIVERLSEEPYLRARVELIDEPTTEGQSEEELEALKRSVSALFDQAIRLSPALPDELRSLTQAVNEPHVMADLVAAHMSLNVASKQEILECAGLDARLKKLLGMLSKEVRVLELASKVQTEVNYELSKSQRDYYLREQLKAIQKELGEYDDRAEELDELWEKIQAADLPEEADKEVKRDYDRMKRMNPGSPEYSVARTYVDTILALPWHKSTVDNLDLKHSQAVLDGDHFGLEKVKDRIIEFLAVRKVKTDGRLRQ